MESVSDALKRLADGASCEGFPTDARELREVEKRVAELIAADEEYDAADRAFDYSALDTTAEIEAASARYSAAIKRRAAALLACKGQTMSAERTCEGCRWFEPANRVWPAGCANRGVMQGVADVARGTRGDCGPSGRYWEPREDKPCTP